MIPRLNDGSTAAPRLRLDLNIGTLFGLPTWSSAPVGEPRAVLAAAMADGYQGFQGPDGKTYRALGAGHTGYGAVTASGQAIEIARQWRERGADAVSLFVGTGFEDEATALGLFEEVLRASADTELPLLVETHRATLTQDPWRTVGFVRRLPELRFNGDLSHWYTGCEFPNGDLQAKIDYIAPVLDRVRFMHGRIGDPGCIQVDVGADVDAAVERPYVQHFVEMWTRAMAGFLREAAPGDYLPFAPELLGPGGSYARQRPGADGTLEEESDRYAQAQVLCRLAERCFAAARETITVAPQKV